MSEQTDILELEAAIDSAFQRHEAGEPGDSLLDTLASLDDLEWPERGMGDRIAAGLTSDTSVVPLKRHRPMRTALGVGAVALVASLIVVLVAFLAFPTSPTTRATPAPVAGNWRLAGYYVPPGFRQTGQAGLAGPMTCPSVNTCYIVNSELTPNEPGKPLLTLFAVSVSHDHGATWTGVPSSGISSFTTGLTCPDSSGQVCFAGGMSGPTPALLKTADGGATWVSTPLPADAGHLSNLACTSESHCVGVFTASEDIFNQQGNTQITNDAGGTWAPAVTDGSLLDTLACTDSTCISYGNLPASPGVQGSPATFYSHDSGATWHQSTLPTGASMDGYLDQTVCPTQRVCWAIAVGGSVGLATSSDVIVSTDGGTTWTFSPTPPTTQLLFAISCPSPNDCWLGGGPAASAKPGFGVPEVWHTTNGGTSWTTTVLAYTPDTPNIAPDSLMGIGQIFCSGNDVCVALGQGDPGAKYTASYSTPPFHPPRSSSR